MNVFIVVPTIRSLSFLSSWGDEFSSCTLVVVEDHPHKEIRPPTRGFLSVLHFDWGDIAGEFGRDEWIFSRRNAGIRSYGFWKAYEAGADVIITLDDDCYFVESGFVATHIANLQSKAPERWATTFPDPRYMYTRGYPYAIRGKRKVVISHGLWSDKMDLDAKTQLSLGAVHAPAYPPIRQYVPPGSYFPMSSMNLAFSREAVPLMYFPLMGFSPEGDAWGYDRYDDIWAGLFAKKILDHLGWSASNGSPFVEHRKASDPLVNRKKERSGMAKNELLWQLVDQVRLTARSPAACYRQLAERIGFPEERYFVSLRKAMIIWSHLFG